MSHNAFLAKQLCLANSKHVIVQLKPEAEAPFLQVRTASCSAANCVNTFGDEQLAVDLLADKLLFEALKYSVCCCSSAVLHALLTSTACQEQGGAEQFESPGACR